MRLAAPGSTLWLLRHELRINLRNLGWRRARTGGDQASPKRGLIVLGVLLGLGGLACLPLAFLAHRFHIRQSHDPLFMAGLGLAMLVLLSLLVSQTLAQATDAFYERGDLDLLLSSPLPARKVLTVRALSLGVSAAQAFALLGTPFILTAAVLDGPAWLGVYLALLALSLIAAALGVAGAMALFALIGPRRTRVVAQVLAAFIGAGFFLTLQSRNFMSRADQAALFARIVGWLSHEGPGLRALLWPGQALLARALPLAALCAFAMTAFALAVALLGRRFGDNAAAAGGAETGVRKTAASAGQGRFAGGLFTAVLRKEMRLLWRDPALMSQVLLRILYLLPLTFVLLHNVKGAGGALIGVSMAGVLTVIAGQIATSLAFIIISAEDAPELLAASPASAGLIPRAKLAAVLIPTAALMSPALVALAFISPWAAAVAVVGWSYSALCSALIEQWHAKPAQRSEFRNRRRRAGSLASALGGFSVSLLAAGATALAALDTRYSLLLVVPLILSMGIVGLVYGLRPRPSGSG